jgi:hypothetical protein
MLYEDISLAELLMVHMVNPFTWTPNIADLKKPHNPNHIYLTDALGGTPLEFKQVKPIPPGTLAMLVIGNLYLPLSSESPETFTLYLPEENMLNFEIRMLGNNASATMSLNNSVAGQNGVPVWGSSSVATIFSQPDTPVTENVAGEIIIPKLTLSPASSKSVCVHGDATDWYSAVVSPGAISYLSGLVDWSASAWTLEENNASARLLVSGRGPATLTASLGPGLLIGPAFASVEFHKCGGEEDPVSNDNPDCNTSNCTNNPIHTLNVTLTTDNDNLTLKHDREANLEIKHDATGNISAYRIDIKHKNKGDWYDLADTKLFPWEATVADKFELRGVVKYNNLYYASPKIDATVLFPTQDQIKSDPDVLLAMHQAWSNSVAYSETYNDELREYGFYIQLNTASNKYVILNRQPGNPVKIVDAIAQTFAVGISLGARPIESTNPTPLDKPTYSVGWFHTHTPMTYVPDYIYRDVGPSKTDIDFSKKYLPHLPGFVYDYTGYWGIIRGEPGIDAATEIHNIPPIDRRPLP